jgi:hypothetical protein
MKQIPVNDSIAARITAMALTLALALAVVGCSSDDETPVVVPGTSISVSGHVFKGSVAGATVHVHAITATGTVGAVIAGPFTTDANGRWSGEVPSGTAGVSPLPPTADHMRTSPPAKPSTWSPKCEGSCWWA